MAQRLRISPLSLKRVHNEQTRGLQMTRGKVRTFRDGAVYRLGLLSQIIDHVSEWND